MTTPGKRLPGEHRLLRYVLGETDDTCAIHIESSTFPNWIGTNQKRSFIISGDELKWTTPTVSLGSGTALDVWKRAE